MPGCPPGGWPKKGGINKRMTLSKDLDVLVGAKGAKMSRPQLVKKLWVYIKEHNLQNVENKRMFTPDAAMAKVFGKKEMTFGTFGMMKYLTSHVSEETPMTKSV